MTTTMHPETTRHSDPLEGPESRSATRDRVAHDLFCQACSCESDQERGELLGHVIELHLDVADSMATRYRSRGVPLDDLRQVAAVALIKATRRYDVTLGYDFMSYAVPTIRGEIRKHFRDHGWMIRPPRRIQDLQARITQAETELTQQLGRSPLPHEMADHLGQHHDAVLEALVSDGCFVPASLEHPISALGTTTLGGTVIKEDRGYVAAEARLLLHPLLRDLPERDREILRMRFFEDLTQSEIAAHMGRSQMTVSRHLTRILAQLRSTVGDSLVG